MSAIQIVKFTCWDDTIRYINPQYILSFRKTVTEGRTFTRIFMHDAKIDVKESCEDVVNIVKYGVKESEV